MTRVRTGSTRKCGKCKTRSTLFTSDGKCLQCNSEVLDMENGINAVAALLFWLGVFFLILTIIFNTWYVTLSYIMYCICCWFVIRRYVQRRYIDGDD